MTLPKSVRDAALAHAVNANVSPRDKHDVFMLAVEWLWSQLPGLNAGISHELFDMVCAERDANEAKLAIAVGALEWISNIKGSADHIETMLYLEKSIEVATEALAKIAGGADGK